MISIILFFSVAGYKRLATKRLQDRALLVMTHGFCGFLAQKVKPWNITSKDPA